MGKHAKGKVGPLGRMARFAMRLPVGCLATLIVAICSMSGPASAQLVVRKNVGVKAFETCATTAWTYDGCINASRALEVLFGMFHANTNVAIHTIKGSQAVAQVIRMVRFDLNKQRHVIFLVQSNDIGDSGVLPYGHASGAYLSYIIFRYRHKKWEFVTREFMIEEQGQWGRIDLYDESGKDALALYGLPRNHLLMTIRYETMHQGFGTEGMRVYHINLGIPLNSGTYRDDVLLTYSNCSGLETPDEPDMKSQLTVDASMYPPVFKVVERYFAACSSKPLRQPSATKVYRFSDDNRARKEPGN
jgi:hypothetical protein